MAGEAIQCLGGNGYINEYPDRPPVARRQTLRDRRRHLRDPPHADRAGTVRGNLLTQVLSAVNTFRDAGRSQIRTETALAIACAMLEGFDQHYRIFRYMSRAAQDRFERADWPASQRAPPIASRSTTSA